MREAPFKQAIRWLNRPSAHCKYKISLYVRGNRTDRHTNVQTDGDTSAQVRSKNDTLLTFLISVLECPKR